MCFKKHLAWCASITKVELRLRFFCCQLDHIHLVQFFLAGHGHVSCGNTGFISCHKVFQLTDLLLLFPVGRLQLCLLNRVDFLEVVVVSYITVQFLIFHVIDDINHRIQERNIVGDKDKSILIIQEISFQPCNVFLIQIVGWLIQKQDVRLLKKQFGKEYLGSLASA